MSRENKLVKTTMILILGTFLPRLINLATTPILTKYTSGSEFGFINFLTTTILSFVIPVSTLQLEQACFRYLVEAKTFRDKARIITSALCLIFIIMIFAAFVCLLIPFDINISYFTWLLILYIWIEILVQMLRFILRAFSMYKHYSFLAAIAVFVNFIVLYICLVFYDMGFIGALIALTIADVVGLVYIVITTRFWIYIKPSLFDFELLKDMLRYALPFVPNSIAGYVNTLSDQWIIISVMDLTANGIYTMAAKIPSILNLIYPAFNLAWTESAISSLEDNDYQKYYNKMFLTIYCMLSAGTVCLIAISPQLFDILNQSESLMSAMLYIPILIVAYYFQCFGQFFSSIYIALKMSKSVLRSTVYAAVVNVVLNIIFIKYFGLYAAVFSTLISNFILAATRYFEINNRYCKLSIPKRLIQGTVVIFVLMSIIALSDNNILYIINYIIAGLFSYVLVSDILKTMILSVKKKLRR